MSFRNFGLERRRGERGSGAPWGWSVVGSGEERVIRERVCRGLRGGVFWINYVRNFFLFGFFESETWILRLILLVYAIVLTSGVYVSIPLV